MGLPFDIVTSDSKRTSTVFIYGGPGSGKTYSLSTLLLNEDILPVLIVSCDGGHKSIVDFCDGEKLILVEANNLDQLSEYYNWCVENDVTLVIDNITELYRSVQQQQKFDRDPSFKSSDFSDYGVPREKFLWLFQNVKNAPINILVTALDNRFTHSTGTTGIEPNLGGKLAAEIPSFFDVVGYMEVQVPTAIEKRNNPKAKAERVIICNPQGEVKIARNRGNCLNDVEKPNLGLIFSKANSKKE